MHFHNIKGRKCHGLHLAKFTTQDIAESLNVRDDVPFHHTIVKSAVQHLNTKQNPACKYFSDNVCIGHPQDQLEH